MRRLPLVLGSWLAGGSLLAAAPLARAADEPPGALSSLPLPVAADALAEAAGLPLPAPRGTVALEVIRRLHAADADPAAAARRRQALTAALAGRPAATAADTVPLPFGEDVWTRVIFRRQVQPSGLAAAILTRPTAAWLYYGGVGLDDETRAWFQARPHRLLRIEAQAGAFATFGPSLNVRGTRVEAPGGVAADPVWQAVVGASPASAEAFVDRLLEAREGRLAWLYDTVARLDAGQQRHLLAGEGAVDRLRRLADVFARVNPEWRLADRPLWRPLVDPAALLIEIEASADGRPLLPEPAAWAGTFGRPDAVDAAWLVDRVFSGDPSGVRHRFELALFAGRWTRDGAEPASRGVVDLFLSAPALALTLERIGVRDNGVASRLQALLDRPELREDATALRVVQASLAVVERAALAGSLDAAAARGLMAALLDAVEAGGVSGGVGTWVAGPLMTATAPLAASGELDARLASFLSGPKGSAAPIEWEGQRYVADPSAAARERLERVREAQGRPSIALAGGDSRALADGLVALVYAAVLPAFDPELLASRPETRHDLGVPRGPGASLAWRIAEPVSSAGVPWHLAGSLLALDVALAVPSLRRVSDDPPAPTLPAADRVAFARTVALLPARALTDATRDTVVRLVDAGRRRLAAVAVPADARAVAAAAGVSPWRREALAWAVTHDRASVAGALSATELAWAGDPAPADRAALDLWGTARLAATGELATRAPRPRPWEPGVGHDARAGLATAVADLNLRIATFLAGRRLPAAIGRDLLSAATLQLVDRAVAPRADDWRALVEAIRAIPEARLEDFVAALTAEGPLRPVRHGETGQ